MNRRLPLVWMLGKETWAELKDANRVSSNPMPGTLLDDDLMVNLTASYDVYIVQRTLKCPTRFSDVWLGGAREPNLPLPGATARLKPSPSKQRLNPKRLAGVESHPPKTKGGVCGSSTEPERAHPLLPLELTQRPREATTEEGKPCRAGEPYVIDAGHDTTTLSRLSVFASSVRNS